jgi:hypothetical protein
MSFDSGGYAVDHGFHEPGHEATKLSDHSFRQLGNGDSGVCQFRLSQVQQLGVQARASHSLRLGCHFLPLCSRLLEETDSASSISALSLFASAVPVLTTDAMGGAALHIGQIYDTYEFSGTRTGGILGNEDLPLRSSGV